MAKAGYLVFAPNHCDATGDGSSAKWLDKAAQPFGKVDAWKILDIERKMRYTGHICFGETERRQAPEKN